MNPQKYTQKTLEAIQQAQTLTTEYSHQTIEQPHLLLALLQQENGLIPQLISAMGPAPESLAAAVGAELRKLPSVSGPGRESGKMYISNGVDKSLNQAEKIGASRL